MDLVGCGPRTPATPRIAAAGEQVITATSGGVADPRARRRGVKPAQPEDRSCTAVDNVERTVRGDSLRSQLLRDERRFVEQLRVVQPIARRCESVDDGAQPHTRAQIHSSQGLASSLPRETPAQRGKRRVGQLSPMGIASRRMDGREEQRNADAAGKQHLVDRLEAVLGRLRHQIGADPGAAAVIGPDRPALDLHGDLFRHLQVRCGGQARCGSGGFRCACLPIRDVQLRPLLEHERGSNERFLELKVAPREAFDLFDRCIEAGSDEEPLQPLSAAQGQIRISSAHREGTGRRSEKATRTRHGTRASCSAALRRCPRSSDSSDRGWRCVRFQTGKKLAPS